MVKQSLSPADGALAADGGSASASGAVAAGRRDRRQDLTAPLGEVVQALEDDIIFGRLRPNDRLVEDTLIERYRAKRHVVRQSFAELETRGMVVREPNRGARIRGFSPKEVADIYDVRALLQGHAAALVPMPAPPSLLAELEGIQRAHSAAVDAADLRDVYHRNNEFHDAIFSACGNDYLAGEIRRYATLAHAIRSYRIGDPTLLEQARAEHVEMIEALRAGERETFVSLCVAHIEPSRRAYLEASAGATSG